MKCKTFYLRKRGYLFLMETRLSNLFIYLFLSVFTLFFCTTAQASPKAADSDKPIHLIILGTSDVHGRFVPWDYATDTEQLAGSLTQLSTAIKQIRAENPNVILVDAGDSIQDNNVEMFNTKKQQPMVVAMNYMNYDTWTMGNHEFNFGLPTLKHVTDQFKGYVLCGNVYWQDGKRFMPATAVIKRGGVRVGIIGMDTPMIKEFEKKADHLKGVIVNDPVNETQKAIKELKGKADIIIGVMHMGLPNENNIPHTSVTDVANACPELTAIVAGHMHKNVSSATVNGVLISEPYKYGRALTRIDIYLKKVDGKYVVTEKKAQTIDMKNVPSDKALEKILAPFHEQERAEANKRIGTLVNMNMVPRDIIDGIPAVQTGETPLVDFFLKVQLHYSKADAAVISIDNDKARLDVGPIKKKDIAYNYQYTGGETTVYKFTGKELKAYMEWAADYYNTIHPGDITPSFNPKRRASKYSTNDMFGGVKYTINLREAPGHRIKDLRFAKNNAPITDSSVVLVGMNAYRLNQLIAKDGPLASCKIPEVWSSTKAFGEKEGTIRNMAIRYIKEVAHGNLKAENLHFFQIIGFDPNSADYKQVAKLVKEGKLSVPKSTDGKYINIAPITQADLKKALTK